MIGFITQELFTSKPKQAEPQQPTPAIEQGFRCLLLCTYTKFLTLPKKINKIDLFMIFLHCLPSSSCIIELEFMFYLILFNLLFLYFKT